MSEKIENHKYTIEEAFRECFYIVPDYQREYIWTEKEVHQLLEDIDEQLDSGPTREYFIGTILVSPTQQKNHFEVIDGQQRLTTFFLLLCALRQRFQGKPLHSLFSGLLATTYTDAQGNLRTTLKLEPRYEHAGELMTRIVAIDADPQTTRATIAAAGIPNFGSLENLLNAYSTVHRCLNDSYDDISKLQKYWGYLANNVVFIQILTDMSSALKIFETINERGVGLDPMDLLKNLLFTHVKHEEFNYRNPDTRTRAAVLRKLLWGQRRDVLLLTATPVNNSLWDLFHLLRFFVRQDAFLANRGILSIRERFEHAAREDPAALSPDMLYPIIDATTVKRTRQFVKKHYSGDQIILPDGRVAQIVFPTPQAITVRYALPDPMPDLFDLIEGALDPDQGKDSIRFARYTPDLYLREEAEDDASEEEARAAATVGLLRSGLLKRFESSAFAFGCTLDKLISEHRTFLEALDRGHVVTTRFMRELAASDETSLDDLLAVSGDTSSAGDYDLRLLRRAVADDLAKLERLREAARRVTPDRDPKLAAVVAALEKIAADADHEAISEDDARQKRKVIVFSFFADTVSYLREELAGRIKRNPKLAAYRDRIVAVSGTEGVEPEEIGRQRAVSGFAPISTEATAPEDRFDLLIATDVLAEGVNLQQCRHVVNYDVPWNPMRLVQRHGRIDRIGSQHPRVFLRTIFPADRLDQLLKLEERIMQKIAMAAASIGVASPVQGGAVGRQVFTETREEIERLLNEDATLFERGGSGGAGQTGEEYRQTLRRAMEQNPHRVPRMPWGVGSGMVKGTAQGVFFCASVGERTYLRVVPTRRRMAPPRRRNGDRARDRHLPAHDRVRGSNPASRARRA